MKFLQKKGKKQIAQKGEIKMKRFEARRVQKRRNKIEKLSNVMIGIGIMFVMFASGDLNTLQQTAIRLIVGLINLSIGWFIKMAVISVNKNHPMDKWLNQ